MRRLLIITFLLLVFPAFGFGKGDSMMSHLLSAISREVPELQFSLSSSESNERFSRVRYPQIESTDLDRVIGPDRNSFMLAFSYSLPPDKADAAEFPFARFPESKSSPPWIKTVLAAELYEEQTVVLTVYMGKDCESAIPLNAQIAFIKAVKKLRASLNPI